MSEKKVLAQGVFDIIHPGHIHYLRKSKKLGDQLTVIIAREENTEKQLYFTEKERKKVVESLKPVNQAIIGKKNIKQGLKQVNPDIITIGYDQDYNTEKIRKMAENLLDKQVRVERITKNGDYSSTKIKESQELQ